MPLLEYCLKKFCSEKAIIENSKLFWKTINLLIQQYITTYIIKFNV